MRRLDWEWLGWGFPPTSYGGPVESRRSQQRPSGKSAPPVGGRGSLSSARGPTVVQAHKRPLREPSFQMSDDSKPLRPPLSHSPARASEDPDESNGAQLSPRPGVEKSVSSVAMDRGAVMGAMRPQLSADLRQVSATTDASSDAAIMLPVRAGDQPACDYLVQKYRRPLGSFMYRMAPNPAAAEVLAQEVFLRVYRSRATYAARAKFTTWLSSIAHTLAVDH